jgi:hypothetical protein
MKTLKQQLYKECDKLIKCNYPCDSCYGCENTLKLFREWLEQRETDDVLGEMTATEFKDELLASLDTQPLQLSETEKEKK